MRLFNCVIIYRYSDFSGVAITRGSCCSRFHHVYMRITFNDSRWPERGLTKNEPLRTVDPEAPGVSRIYA